MRANINMIGPRNARTPVHVCAISSIAHPAFEMQHLLTVAVPTDDPYHPVVSILCTSSVWTCVCARLCVEYAT